MQSALPFAYVKLEQVETPSPEVPPSPPPEPPKDPKDPEDFLGRCSGQNKRTGRRCHINFGKKSQQTGHPQFLPTCKTHRRQESFAGRCQFKMPNGQSCDKLFKWTPPYLEMCIEHEKQPDTPCYLFKLPTELRQEIFRYLLPVHPIGSSTGPTHSIPSQMATLSDKSTRYWDQSPKTCGHFIASYPPHQMGKPLTAPTVFPMPLMNLLLVCRQFACEVKSIFFSTSTFRIDIRRDGTFMCGRRLLEPTRADGTSHVHLDETTAVKDRFLKSFDWKAVKNYSVEILLENWAAPQSRAHLSLWDEEVEMYDIRDYVSVVVSGILAKSENLCKLQIGLCMADFPYTEEQVLANAKLVLGPFERLRNVRKPEIPGIFFGRHPHNAMTLMHCPIRHDSTSQCISPLCSVPPLPVHSPVLVAGMKNFDEYVSGLTQLMTTKSSARITLKPQIRAMFTEVKDFYTKLSNIVPHITYPNGRQAWLHRARVAREKEDVMDFRIIRNGLVGEWEAYLENEERKRADMNSRLSRMLDSDTYPSLEDEDVYYPPESSSSGSSSSVGSSSKSPQMQVVSPVQLNADAMLREGIPMAANPSPFSEQDFPGLRDLPAPMRLQMQAQITMMLQKPPQRQAMLRHLITQQIRQQQLVQARALYQARQQQEAQQQEAHRRGLNSIQWAAQQQAQRQAQTQAQAQRRMQAMQNAQLHAQAMAVQQMGNQMSQATPPLIMGQPMPQLPQVVYQCSYPPLPSGPFIDALPQPQSASMMPAPSEDYDGDVMAFGEKSLLLSSRGLTPGYSSMKRTLIDAGLEAEETTAPVIKRERLEIDTDVPRLQQQMQVQPQMQQQMQQQIQVQMQIQPPIQMQTQEHSYVGKGKGKATVACA